MSHSSTELLIDYWQNRISNGRAPARSTINPMDFPTLLPQVFMLGRLGPGDYAFRLAGGLLRDLHGHDLRQTSFARLWTENARLPVQTALERARRDVEPVHFQATALAGEHRMALEILALPIANEKGVVDRMLGLYQPKSPVARLRGAPIDVLMLDDVFADDSGRPKIRLAAVGGQRVG